MLNSRYSDGLRLARINNRYSYLPRNRTGLPILASLGRVYSQPMFHAFSLSLPGLIRSLGHLSRSRFTNQSWPA